MAVVSECTDWTAWRPGSRAIEEGGPLILARGRGLSSCRRVPGASPAPARSHSRRRARLLLERAVHRQRTDLHAACEAVLSLGTAGWLTGEKATHNGRPRYSTSGSWRRLVHESRPRLLAVGAGSPERPRVRRDRRPGPHLVCTRSGVRGASSRLESRSRRTRRGWYRRYLCWLLLSRKSDEEKNSGDYHAAWWAAQVGAYADFVVRRRSSRRRVEFVESGKANMESAPEALALVARLEQNHGQTVSVSRPGDISGYRLG